MNRYLRPLIDYIHENFLYFINGGYEKDWTKKELLYIDVSKLGSTKSKAKSG